MRLDFGLRVEQTQKLIMTPELRQAIQILQLSGVELADYVDKMITEKPMIEIQEEEKKYSRETDWEYYIKSNREERESLQDAETKEDLPFENYIVKEVGLHEHLYNQLSFLELDKLMQRIAYYLIGNIDNCGYLTVTRSQAAADLEVPEEMVKEAQGIVQGFDPPGVGASDLSECLTLQLERKGIDDKQLFELIKNHLELLGTGKIARVAQIMDISAARVQEMTDLLKTLNPKPGAAFDNAQIRYIVPDITVERVGEDYAIYINDGYIPRLSINKTYSSILGKKGHVDEETRNFVETKLNQALWLIRSIEQRRMTIYRVAEAMVQSQRKFFDQGIKYLRPLTLKQIAARINVHESTVSRATDNKYMQTPHGIFPLKFFFSSGLSTESGEAASSESVKILLQDIIKSEDPQKPYSDQKISDVLQKKGVHVARRTIAKYREELGIPNTGARKRY